VNELEQTGLAAMRDCWITGGPTFDVAPAAWKEIAGTASPDELSAGCWRSLRRPSILACGLPHRRL